MTMIFCRGCGKEIHDTAAACPHCGAAQSGSSAVGHQESKWMAITSLVLGILALLGAMGLITDGGDADEMMGVVLFGVLSLVFAVLSLVQKRWGKSLSITGIVLSAIGLLAIIGS